MKIYAIIPTYKECANIKKLIPTILKTVPGVHILVIDDNSPDNTANEVKKFRKKYPRKVHLLLRRKKRGRGSAGVDGFRYALRKGADIVIEMDADFSHNPKFLPRMLQELENSDVVLGSRLVAGGEDRREPIRHLITILGCIYIRVMLGLKIRDCTSGYRIFKNKVLKKIKLDRLISPGWSIVQEILFRADLLGFTIKEVPIVFVDRKRGFSKFNPKIMLQSILMVLVLKFIFSDVWKEGGS